MPAALTLESIPDGAILTVSDETGAVSIKLSNAQLDLLSAAADEDHPQSQEKVTFFSGTSSSNILTLLEFPS